MRNRVVVSLIFLIMWTILVLTNNVGWFDDLVYDFVYGLKCDNLTSFMRIITSFSSVKVMVLLTALSLIGLIWKRKESIYLVTTLGISTIINLVFNLVNNSKEAKQKYSCLSSFFLFLAL